MATLELDHITKRFGKDVLAVNNLSLTVNDGEFLVSHEHFLAHGIGISEQPLLEDLSQDAHASVLVDIGPREKAAGPEFQLEDRKAIRVDAEGWAVAGFVPGAHDEMAVRRGAEMQNLGHLGA